MIAQNVKPVLILLLVVLTIPSHFVHPVPTPEGTVLANGGIVGLALDPIRPRLYLLNESSGTIDILNTTSNTITSRVHVGSGLGGVDISQDDSQLYVVLRGTKQLAIVSLDSLTVLKPVNLTFTPGDVAAGRQGRAYLSHQFDFLFTAVDTQNRTELATIMTSETGGTVGTSPDRNYLYIGYRGIDPCIIDKYGVSTDSIQSLGSPPWGSIGGNFGDMVVDPDNVHLYVMCAYPYEAQWLNTVDWSLSETLPTGAYPSAIGLAPTDQLAFTAQGSNIIDVFNKTTRTLLQTYQTTATVQRIVSLPDGSKFYAITSGGNLEAFNPPTWPQYSKLIAAAKSPTQISLEWTPASTATSAYEIVGGPAPIFVSPATVNYTVTRLTPSTRNNFTVYIMDPKGELSITGPSASATTLPDNTPPTWPQGSIVNASDITPISLTLTWTRAIDDVSVTNYRVYENNTILLTLGNTTIVVIAGLSQKTTYTFQIQASDQSNNWSTDGPSTSIYTPTQSNLPGPYGIVYDPTFPSTATRGSRITLVSNISDTGPSQIKILSLNVNSGIGVFAESNLPVILQPGTYRLLNISLTVPAGPSVNSPTVYYLTTYVTWQYLDPTSDTWLSGIPDPLIANPTLLVLDHPYTPGVSPGNTATYSVSLSTIPNTKITDVLTVINVTGPRVFYTQQFYVGKVLANTTEGSTNVITGVNTGPIYVPFAFVASNLTIGYPLYSGFQSIPVSSVSNETLTGKTRHCISVTTGQATGPLQLNATWDAYTGLLGNLNAISTNRTSFTANYTLVSTNAWTNSVPSITNLLTPGILRIAFIAWGVYVAFALTLSLILILREQGKHRHRWAKSLPS